MSSMHVFSGMSLRDALKVASHSGCRVKNVRRTGEIAVSHPGFLRRVRVNARKKDASRKLIGFLLGILRMGSAA